MLKLCFDYSEQVWNTEDSHSDFVCVCVWEGGGYTSLASCPAMSLVSNTCFPLYLTLISIFFPSQQALHLVVTNCWRGARVGVHLLRSLRLTHQQMIFIFCSHHNDAVILQVFKFCFFYREKNTKFVNITHRSDC